jgi:hypothetical protein
MMPLSALGIGLRGLECHPEDLASAQARSFPIRLQTIIWTDGRLLAVQPILLFSQRTPRGLHSLKPVECRFALRRAYFDSFASLLVLGMLFGPCDQIFECLEKALRKRRLAHAGQARLTVSRSQEVVCTENLIRVDAVMESPKLAE